MTITRNFSVLANGAGSANNLSLGGATLGSNALAVTGTTALSGLLTAAGGVSSTLTTDATSATTGSIITAGGISTQKALWVGTTSTFAGTMTAAAANFSGAQTNTVAGVPYQWTGNGAAVYPANTAGGAVSYNFSNGNAECSFWNTASSPTVSFVWRQMTGASSNTALMTMNSTGQLCINSTSGSGKLSVATTNATAIYAVNGGSSSECFLSNVGGTGVAHVTFLYQGAGPVGSISSPNNLSVAYNTVSDERLKNVLPDQRNFRSIITDLWVGDVEWKAEPGSRQMAMLAQQTHPIYPEAIRVGNTADDMWQADYAKLAPLALWGVKDLYKIIEDLTTRLAALEAK